MARQVRAQPDELKVDLVGVCLEEELHAALVVGDLVGDRGERRRVRRRALTDMRKWGSFAEVRWRTSGMTRALRFASRSSISF